MQLGSTPTHKRNQFGRRHALAVLAAIALVAGVSKPASAEFFQYTTSVEILGGFAPGGSGVVPFGIDAPSVTMTTPGGVGITLAGYSSASPGDNIDATGPGSDIVFGTISVAGLTNASLLENVFIPYTWRVTIDDYASAVSLVPIASTTFDINGSITGTVGKVGGGKQVNLSTNLYVPPILPPQLAGLVAYTFALNDYVPPSPLPLFPGAFGAHVNARIVPEPGTLALFGFGLIALATPALRRLRRKS